MMTMDSLAVRPSREARQLFNQMVALSDSNLHLHMEQSLVLGVNRIRNGKDPHCLMELQELITEGWIDPSADGGWLLH